MRVTKFSTSPLEHSSLSRCCVLHRWSTLMMYYLSRGTILIGGNFLLLRGLAPALFKEMCVRIRIKFWHAHLLDIQFSHFFFRKIKSSFTFYASVQDLCCALDPIIIFCICIGCAFPTHYWVVALTLVKLFTLYELRQHAASEACWTCSHHSKYV